MQSALKIKRLLWQRLRNYLRILTLISHNPWSSLWKYQATYKKTKYDCGESVDSFMPDMTRSTAFCVPTAEIRQISPRSRISAYCTAKQSLFLDTPLAFSLSTLHLLLLRARPRWVHTNYLSRPPPVSCGVPGHVDHERRRFPPAQQADPRRHWRTEPQAGPAAMREANKERGRYEVFEGEISPSSLWSVESVLKIDTFFFLKKSHSYMQPDVGRPLWNRTVLSRAMTKADT